jgi:hypothetical protein
LGCAKALKPQLPLTSGRRKLDLRGGSLRDERNRVVFARAGLTLANIGLWVRPTRTRDDLAAAARVVL